MYIGPGRSAIGRRPSPPRPFKDSQLPSRGATASSDANTRCYMAIDGCPASTSDARPPGRLIARECAQTTYQCAVCGYDGLAVFDERGGSKGRLGDQVGRKPIPSAEAQILQQQHDRPAVADAVERQGDAHAAPTAPARAAPRGGGPAARLHHVQVQELDELDVPPPQAVQHVRGPADDAAPEQRAVLQQGQGLRQDHQQQPFE